MRKARCLIIVCVLAAASVSAVAGPRPDPFAPLGNVPYISPPSPVVHSKAYRLPPVSLEFSPKMPATGIQPLPVQPVVPTVAISPSAMGDWTLVGLMSSGQQACAMFTSTNSTAVVRAGDTLPDNKAVIAEIDSDAVVVKPLHGDSKARVAIGQSYKLTSTDMAITNSGNYGTPVSLAH